MNCYLDETRAGIGRAHKIPRAMGPAYLAGAFSPATCDVRVYSELSSGPLEDERLLAWPDMLVLTGLTTALDRMRHLTAYVRTKNPKVIVVAGGHAVRALPRYCRRFLDYACLGDVEELRDVIIDAFGTGYVADEMLPRFDLVGWLGRVGYLETSRYCNFRCSFCTLTAERRRYFAYDIDVVRRQILALGRRKFLVFLDNNFFGNDRRRFSDLLDLLRELYDRGQFEAWSALVTSDFFLDERNLDRAQEAGCAALFTGVECFDDDWLRRNNKSQNARVPQRELIARTLESGIVFLYGLVLDVVTRSVAEIHRELDTILDDTNITLPGYLSVSIPILGTPFFHDCRRRERLLPNTRVRDLDGTTLSVRPMDPVDDVTDLLRDLTSMRGYRTRILRHMVRFTRRYRRRLSAHGLAVALSNGPLLCAPVAVTQPTSWRRPPRRTYLSSTDILDRVYTPAFPVDRRYASYFTPTPLTDASGNLAEEIAEDLSCSPPS